MVALDEEQVQLSRVEVLAPEQAAAAGRVFARSHADYPSFRSLFPDPAHRTRALSALFTGVARDAARLGSAYGAVGSDREVHGVALWLAPGKFPWSASRQLRGTGWMLSVLLADPRSFRRFMQTGTNGARAHPDYPHWYLESMGVDPALQRQGVGGRLLQPVLKIADRDRIDCYLETADPSNVGYYARHGFEVRTKPSSWSLTGRPTSPCGAAPPPRDGRTDGRRGRCRSDRRAPPRGRAGVRRVDRPPHPA